MGRSLVMSDLRQAVMEGAAIDISSGSPDPGHEFLRLAAPRSLQREKRKALEFAIEFEVVPRLILAHQNCGQATPRPDLEYPNQIEDFAELLLGRNEDAA